MTDNDDNRLTPDAFSPASPSSRAGADEQLAATRFEPLSEAATTQRRISVTQLALALAGVAIALLLFFLFTARSLTLNIEAETPPDFSLSGLNWSFGERLLVRPGEYVLSVTAEGYHPYEQTITVTEAETQRLDIALAPLPGTVSIITTPPGADITLDGLSLGSAPLNDIVLESGRYAVGAALARFQPWASAVEVAGRNQSQTVQIALVPDWAYVTFTATPSEVIATIDGDTAEVTDRGVEVLSGEHELTLSAPGFMPVTVPLQIVAGIDQTLGAISLTPADATVSLSSTPSGAGVTVDGAFTGLTPLIVPLSPDATHTVRVSKAGFRTSSLTLALARGDTAERSVTLSPELGEVRFVIEPPDANILVNGQAVGTGNQTLDLPAITQRIEIALPGYATFKTELLPKPGLPQQVQVTLLTEAAARTAAMKPSITTPLGQTLVLVDPSVESQNPFTMGASRRDPGRRANEVEHPVELRRAFYMASTETTNAQFRQFEATHDSGLIGSYSLDRDHQPVAGISWQQATSFCNWLSRLEGLPPFYRENQGIIIGFNPSSTGYRLPSEAEWAFASRVEGDQLRRFAWGDEFPPTEVVTNVADNTSALVTGRILNGYTDQFVVSAPVGSFLPNHRGLHDMGGNVAEWVHDGYRIPSANAELEIDPLGAQRGDNYTIRGGSWALSRLSELRLTFRDYGERGRDDLGFRIARYAE